ncbi:DUF4405 domain-containing protein [Sulfurospirillum sp. 1612]|uniref:DUF4405 domain-containing protein n=1 Tax=Sulfurospirillum sp. 1612 TaxID=3094835 RepID=UPI002F947C96
MNRSSLKDIATSMTSLVFLVIAISGVMLYFHILDGSVKSMHEIMGLVFVAVAALHLFFNFKPMKRYFGKKIFMVSVILVGLVSTGFIINSSNGSNNPKQLMIKSLLNAPIADSLKVLNIEYNHATQILKSKGIMIENNQNIDAIAKANQLSPIAVVKMLQE